MNDPIETLHQAGPGEGRERGEPIVSGAADMPFDELAEVVRGFVAGHDWNIQAAARLAADSPVVLRKLRPFVDADGWVDWATLAEHVEVSGWSSGEKAMVRLACSLAGYAPPGGPSGAWLLGPMLASLDETNSRLVVQAVRCAAMGPQR
jgi:hypothetical protein